MIAGLMIAGLTPAIGIHQLFVKFLLSPLSVADPQRLFHFDRTQSYPTVRFLRERFRSQPGQAVDCFAWYSGIFNAPFSLQDGSGQQSDVSYDFISGNGIGLLGIRPALGRVLNEQDDEGLKSAPAWSVNLSYAYWTSHYGRDPRILNAVVIIHDTPVRIVGVLPASFTGLMTGEHADILLPLPFIELLRQGNRRLSYLEDPNLPLVDVYGRTRGPLSLSSMQADINGLIPLLIRETGITWLTSEATVAQFRISSGAYGHSWLRETYRKPLIVLDLLAAAVMVLSASAIYGLTVLSLISREPSLAIKTALGASRRRLLFKEAIYPVIVILLSTAVSLLLASRLTVLVAQPFVEALSKRQTFNLTYGLSSAKLPLLMALALCAMVMIMTARAIRRIEWTLSSSLRTGATVSPRAKRRAGAVVFIQVAVASLLVASCTVLTLNLKELLSIDPGFSLRRLALITVGLKAGTRLGGAQGPSDVPDGSSQLAARLLKQARSVPGLETASISAQGLFSGVIDTASVIKEDDAGRPTLQGNLDLLQVSPGFFQSMSIPLFAGREFKWDDRHSCMLDGLAARQLFPNGMALGKTLAYRLEESQPDVTCTVVGISQPVTISDIRRTAAALLILPYFAATDNGFPVYVLARSNDIKGNLVPRITEELATIDPKLSITRVEDIQQEVDESFGRERIMAILSLLFGICSLLVAGAGLFASLFYQVKSRTAEFGIRMALGADHVKLAQPLVGQAAALCLPAIVLGVGLAVWMSHAAAAFLFDPKLSRPGVSIVSSAFVLSIVAACVAVAVARIRRLDPSDALRAP